MYHTKYIASPQNNISIKQSSESEIMNEIWNETKDEQIETDKSNDLYKLTQNVFNQFTFAQKKSLKIIIIRCFAAFLFCLVCLTYSY